MSTKKHNCLALKFFRGLTNTPSSAEPEKKEEESVSAEPTPVDLESSENNEQGEIQNEVPVETRQKGDRINSALQAFQSDPVAFMNKLPTKYDDRGEQVGSSEGAFCAAPI
ncbi:MAG: hypothetical protein D3924_14410 [Candidatus Electrothrix sp. AR4]|nr:hypothetical protein [Candidatus Electrothrix sp. AR4]